MRWHHEFIENIITLKLDCCFTNNLYLFWDTLHTYHLIQKFLEFIDLPSYMQQVKNWNLWCNYNLAIMSGKKLSGRKIVLHESVHVGINSGTDKEDIWAPSSEFVSSSIPSWQTLTAHAQPFRGARDLAFCLKVPLDSLLVWASSEGSGETARMRRLAWTFAARIGNKHQIHLTQSILW